jgi:hypothetical protein
MKTHIVRQGECLLTIAERCGVPWKKIWTAPENAKLKQKGRDPNILLPGDELKIPEKEVKEERGAIEQRHRFRTTGKTRYLKIVMQDPQGNPLAHRPYILQIDGLYLENSGGSTLETDADGVIECCIPASATEGKLFIDGDTWVLNLSYLDPVETTEGLQARLNNLNYQLGPVDGIEGLRTREAIRNFQRDNDLVIDGVYGPKTQEKLRQVHGC